MSDAEQTPCAWFEDEARCYVEQHQGCTWCGGSYCVFRVVRDDRIEYHCGGCEFYVCHEPGTGRYFVALGHGRRGAAAAAALPTF